MKLSQKAEKSYAAAFLSKETRISYYCVCPAHNLNRAYQSVVP